MPYENMQYMDRLKVDSTMVARPVIDFAAMLYEVSARPVLFQQGARGCQYDMAYR
ncbi:hypothetical protein MKD01_16420 [[Clostridium] innocuum]|nr:hypothetical protein [[Clostridium] innocuum]MCR0286890.1 hypothetical protein [[Clostridium] innocuum]